MVGNSRAAQHEERREWLSAGDRCRGGLAKPSESLQNERGLTFCDSVKNSLRGSFLSLTSVCAFRIRCKSEVWLRQDEEQEKAHLGQHAWVGEEDDDGPKLRSLSTSRKAEPQH